MNRAKIRAFRKALRRFERLDTLLSDTCCAGVTMAQCHVLLEIEELREATAVQLARNLHLDKSTLSRTVESLVQHGLVIRTTDPEDRRFTTLQLTAQGKKTCDSFNLENDQLYEHVFKNLSRQTPDNIISSLEDLVQAMEVSRQSLGNSKATCPEPESEKMMRGEADQPTPPEPMRRSQA